MNIRIRAVDEVLPYIEVQQEYVLITQNNSRIKSGFVHVAHLFLSIEWNKVICDNFRTNVIFTI